MQSKSKALLYTYISTQAAHAVPRGRGGHTYSRRRGLRYYALEKVVKTKILSASSQNWLACGAARRDANRHRAFTCGFDDHLC